MLNLTADPAVKPGTNQLELVAGSQRVIASVSIIVLSRVQPVPGQLPTVKPTPCAVSISIKVQPSTDLIIASCSNENLQFPGSPITIQTSAVITRATLKNNGSGNVAARPALATAIVPAGQPLASLHGSMTLPAGGTRTIDIIHAAPSAGERILPQGTVQLVDALRALALPGPVWTLAAPGTYPLTWTANPRNLTAELNTGNNARTCSLVVAPPPRPDLVVSSLTVEPAVGSPATRFTFRMTVLNEGQLPASAQPPPRVARTGSPHSARTVPDRWCHWGRALFWPGRPA